MHCTLSTPRVLCSFPSTHSSCAGSTATLSPLNTPPPATYMRMLAGPPPSPITTAQTIPSSPQQLPRHSLVVLYKLATAQHVAAHVKAAAAICLGVFALLHAPWLVLLHRLLIGSRRGRGGGRDVVICWRTADLGRGQAGQQHHGRCEGTCSQATAYVGSHQDLFHSSLFGGVNGTSSRYAAVLILVCHNPCAVDDQMDRHL